MVTMPDAGIVPASSGGEGEVRNYKSKSKEKMVRLVVVGDDGVGKSSLITAVATENAPDRVPPVLPQTILAADQLPDKVPLLMYDTGNGESDRAKMELEIKRADVIVLCYAVNDMRTLESVGKKWMPLFTKLSVRVPVILVGCKMDLRTEEMTPMEDVIRPVLANNHLIESALECSARKLQQILEVFYYAQKLVIHPTAPLFDQESQRLREGCVKALMRIFTLCDVDGDGALSDVELNDFQKFCFEMPLQSQELRGIKEVVKARLPEGIEGPEGAGKMTLKGFLFLHALFIERGRLETTWTVLRKFGYDDNLELRDDNTYFLGPACDKVSGAPDQVVELTDFGMSWLEVLFDSRDGDKDGELSKEEVESIFSTAPGYPPAVLPGRMGQFGTATELSTSERMTRSGFLAHWVMLTAYQPREAIKWLLYVCFDPEMQQLESCFALSKRRSVEWSRQRVTRRVFKCHVYGGKDAGKSALVDGLLSREFGGPVRGPRLRLACKRVRATAGGNDLGDDKYLIMREFASAAASSSSPGPGALVPEPAPLEQLDDCDIAVFVYDRTSMDSFEVVRGMLRRVAGLPNPPPCLLVAAKDDLPLNDKVAEACESLRAELSIPASVPVSSRIKENVPEIYEQLVSVAMQPQYSVPRTEQRRKQIATQRLIRNALYYTTGAASAATASYFIYRWWTAQESKAKVSVE